MKHVHSLSLCLLIIAAALPGRAQDGMAPRLTVEGAGRVRVAPDLAVVRVGIVQQLESADDAQRAVNAVANDILDAVERAGIDSDDVQTARLVLSPVYARPNPNTPDTPRIVAYRASNTVSVRVENLDRVGEVIDAALGAGANQLEGVSFSLQDDREARQDALRAAVREARAKAEVMADALGVSLGPILSVGESGVGPQPMMEMAAPRALALQAADSTPVSPGELELGASVTVVYFIVQPQ